MAADHTLRWVVLFICGITAWPVAGAALIPNDYVNSVTIRASAKSHVVRCERGDTDLFVKVSVNNQNAGYFAIDTGSANTFIDKSVAERLGLRWLVSGGVMDVYACRTVVFSDVNVRMRRIMALDLLGLSRVKGKRISGILGMDVLSKQPFTLDIATSRIVLHQGNSFEKNGRPTKIVFREGKPHLKMVIGEKTNVLALVDSGFTGHLALKGVSREQQEKLSSDPNYVMAVGTGVTGSTLAIRRILSSAELFGQRRTDVPCVFGQIDPLTTTNAIIGGRLLDEFIFTFDCENEQLYVRPSKTPSTVKLNDGDFLGITPLLQRIYDNDVAGMIKAIERGGDVNSRTSQGKPALIAAIVNVSPVFAQRLIAKGAKVNDVEIASGLTVFHMALHRSDRVLFDLLRKKGANIRAVGKKKDTAMHHVASGGNIDVAKELIEADLSVSDRDEQGYTPINLAARVGNAEMIDLLLRHGAKVNVYSNARMTPLGIACESGHVDIAKKLLPLTTDIESGVFGRGSPLVLAARHEVPELLTLLLKRKADVNGVDEQGNTALMIAAKNGHLENMKVLLADGSKLDHKNRKGVTALGIAAAHRHEEVVTYLLKKKADVSDPAVMLTCVSSRIKAGLSICRRLLMAGANPNGTQENGRTPLMSACRSGNTDIAKLLLKSGADVNAESKGGFFVLQQAVVSDKSDLIELLLKSGAEDHSRHPQLHFACELGNPAIVSAFINANWKLNATDSQGMTPLLVAVREMRLKVAKVLLDHGAKLNLKNKKGESALDLAKANDDGEMLTLLKSYD